MEIRSIRSIPFESTTYTKSVRNLPEEGRLMTGTYDKESVLVYMTCGDKWAKSVVAHQTFKKHHILECKDIIITPTYLCAIRKSNWAMEPEKGNILAIRIRRSGFEELIEEAMDRIPSGRPNLVRIEWEDEYSPLGFKTERGSIQLKLYNGILRRFASEMILEIFDVSSFVRKQRQLIMGFSWDHWSKILNKLRVAKESKYAFLKEDLEEEFTTNYL